MAKKTGHGSVSEAKLRRLLQRHQCPMPLHAVRSYFLGGIACPKLETRPLQSLGHLWGGELPEFESMDELNELIEVLVNGLWNDLTRHQSARHPFRLTVLEPPTEPEGIRHFARVRQEELEAFAEGLFDGEEALSLPESAHEAIINLAEMRAFFEGYVRLAKQHEMPAAIREAVHNLQQLSLIAGKEINRAVLGCTRARRQAMAGLQGPGTTRH